MTLFEVNQSHGDLVFDSDGTVLNSLGIKKSVARDVFTVLGFADPAELAAEFSALPGTRANKLRALEKKYNHSISPEKFDAIFTESIVARADEIQVRAGLTELREATEGRVWYLLTNGSQNETRKMYDRLRILDLFDGGIWGSPLDKSTHIKTLGFGPNDLMFSDSREDYELGKEFGIPFIYLAGWNSNSDAAFFERSGQVAFFSF
jgi:phosphoglycolate phosphatase-like HAD superfamily hydrolase